MSRLVLDKQRHITEYETEISGEELEPTRVGELHELMTRAYLNGDLWVPVMVLEMIQEMYANGYIEFGVDLTEFIKNATENAVDLTSYMNSIADEHWDADLVKWIDQHPTSIAVWCRLHQAGWPTSDSWGEHKLYDLEDMAIGQVGSIRTIWDGIVLVQRMDQDKFFHVVLQNINGKWIPLL